MISKKSTLAIAIGILITFCFIAACHRTSSHQEMISILQRLNKKNYDIANPFRPEAKLAHYDSLLSMPGNGTNAFSLLAKAPLLLQNGQEQKSVDIYEDISKRMDSTEVRNMRPGMALAYMRLGERTNCMLNHTGSSCIFPIKDEGMLECFG